MSYSKLKNYAIFSNELGESDKSTHFNLFESTGYRLIDIEILEYVFSLLACPECKQPMLDFSESQKFGSARKMQLECACGWQHMFWSSKKECRSFDINRRFCYAMRSCGQGYSGMKQFSMLMNLPPPLEGYIRKKMTRMIERPMGPGHFRLCLSLIYHLFEIAWNLYSS